MKKLCLYFLLLPFISMAQVGINTTAGNKTYYYIAGRTVTSNTTETLTGFVSTYWTENNIIAYRLN